MPFPKRAAFVLLFAAALFAGSFAVPALAQVVDPSSGLASFAETAGFTSQGDLTLVIARLIRTFISFLGIIAVAFVLYGAILYMTAGGADEKVKRAKKVFTSAVIGLVIILSSFAIVQFVLSRLTSAGEGSISADDDGSSVYADGSGTSSRFLLSSVNTECAEAMRNLQLQLTFSGRVDGATVEAGGIEVSLDGEAVLGKFEVSGKRVTFTPDEPCDENDAADERCFEADTKYELTVDSSVIKSSTGIALECTSEYPCAFSFTTGTDIDLEGPTMTMDAPDDGASVFVGDVELLQALSQDDTGVTGVDFTVDGDVVYQASLLSDSSEGELAKTNYFSTADGTQWDTAGYSTGTYSIRAEGVDCAGHADASAAVSVALRPATCDNGAQDDDEDGVDCGGECGSCDGSACDEDADCASGSCDEETGECVGVPKIEEISPGDGAGGNLVTVSGENFGAVAASVTFLGDSSTTADDVKVTAYECDGSVRWSDDEIVVQVDAAMVDGPVLVETADGYADQTDDDYGPTIEDFDVNGVVRPGICLLDPNSSIGNSQVDVSGNNFGDAQGTSTVYFSNYEASEYDAWADTLLSVVVPLLNARDYSAQVWAGDYECAKADGTFVGDICAEDADCAEDQGESCATKQCSESGSACAEDADCGDDESCVSLRQGSNKVTFTVVDTSAGETPVIAQVATGWEACADDGLRCAYDADCVSGAACEDAPNWGPPGQYVTIYGTAFGTSTGTVEFAGELGTAIGDVEFPEACGDDQWDDTQITVKVPSEYQAGGSVDVGTYSLSVKTALGAESESVEFVVLDDVPGPGICAMDPSSGLPGTTVVTLDGEHFGAEQGVGYVEFYDRKRVKDVELWSSGQAKALVDPETATGPVILVTDLGYESNSLNFSTGDCREDAAVCSVGEQCCGDGTCSSACEEELPVSHYAWRFSTADIPSALKVAVFCGDSDEDGDYDGVSPGPWERWSAPEDICVNASVTATFTERMDQNSFEGNVLVADADGAAVAGSVVATSEYAFEWDPEENFEPNATYTVTLASDGIRSLAGGAMERDYSWNFTTSSSTDLCEVGEIYVSPSSFTATAKDEEVDYAATPVAEEDDCVPLQCAAYDWNWRSSDAARAKLVGDDQGNADACENTAVALAETAAGSSVEIEAGPEGVRNDPTGTGELTVNFLDPEVTSWQQTCDTACLNAGIRVLFSTPMSDDDFIVGDTVTLYVCEDSLCDGDEVAEFSGSYGVSYSDVGDEHALSVAHDDFAADTWYRVVISGEVESASGTPLSASGSNMGSDDNRYYPGAFSWTFKTKNDTSPCSVARVKTVPSEASVAAVGEQTLFEALPYGAPDDCSASGQLLVATSYEWDAWTAKDNPNVGGTTADVAAMAESGSLILTGDLEDGCTSSCLNAGATVTIDDPVCGDGRVTYGEECDGGSNCTAECLNAGNAVACSATVTTECCGDGVLDAGEECDDGAASGGDGCSSVCLNAGARQAGTTCGDGTRDWSPSIGGEDFDDGNARNGDGVSSDCLYEGGVSVEGVHATCGNSIVEDGEDCDDGDADDGDGCSSACLYEGVPSCAYECVGNVDDDDYEDDGKNCSGIGADCGTGRCLPVLAPCCGDARTDYVSLDRAEDCDDGNTDDGDGCSSECLFEGSSVSYDSASYCGDDEIGTGEECDASESASFDVGNIGVSVILATAPGEVVDGVAGASIAASSNGVTGTSQLSLSCSCETDDACGDETVLGCGVGSCCYERPRETARYPAADASDVCRNTSVYADFTRQMDGDTLDPDEADPNLYLELVELDGEAVDVTNCPEGYIDVTFARVDGGKDGWIARAWNWVRSLFGRDATAAGYACLVPVTYSQGANGSGGERVSLRLDDLLEPDATYRFVVVEDSNLSDAVDEGVLSADAVGVAGPSDGTDETTFSTGTEMCELEEVVVEDLGVTESLSNDLVDPSVAYFTEDKEEHTVQASAKTVRGGKRVEIQEITGVYEWSWSWGSTICDDIGGAGCDVDDVVVVATADVTRTTATAAGNTGREFVIATAAFAPTNTFGETSGGVSGDLLVTANVCDNPPTIGYPYEDEVSNFSFFYCRDAGTADDASDDLPELDAPVDVTSHDDDIIQELIFKVSGTSDAIGVRVLKNDAYLRPGVWYEAHGFTGSPQEESLDGYEAVRDGNTLYVAAANHDDSSQRIYPNVYVISYTEDAGEEAQEIFDQILASWSFNSNVQTVSDVNLCAADGEYTTGYACVKGSGETTDGTCSYGDAADGTDVCPSGYACTAASSGELVACEWDGDCAESVGPSYACDADKAKLARDMRRLTDAAYLSGLVEDYGDDNGYCSVTTNLACEGDADCPGSETCEPGVPGLVTGTFVRSYSTSAWPSWTSELANALGVALPKDPINEFYACSDEGYDVETCWNAVSATFTCPDGSHVYGYRGVGGTSFDLYAQLEYGDGAWAYDFASDLGTLVMEQDWGGSSAFLKEGFVSVETFCDGATVGDSTVCGDGVVGGDEKCEIGETTGDDCDSDGDGVADGTGTITVTCASDCSAFQGAYDAESAGGLCVAYECGNGVVEEESGEECDDGSLNGTYGHCGNDCTIGSAFVCGDGYLAGGEQCDCGEVSNFASVMHDSDSWASAHCSTASNGQWIRNPALSCGWDCTAPGPSCGDGEVNGAESCDGDYEEWDGALCADGEPCDDDADCGDGSSCGDGGAACGASTVCEGGADEGVPCADASDCRSGVCGSFEYALARTRTCGALSCEWNAWNSVNGESCLGSETCGDGVVSGGEECDDGNASDTDACTTACLWNVCGDDYVYSGVESCDRGDENGEACDASYGGTCNFCSTTCTYQVMSGAYCGDGETNGTEYCDGSDMPGYCVDTASGSVETLGSCASSEFGTTDACDTDYTCRFVGVCNGGNDNGEKCTIDASSGTDTFACDGGECVVPTCSADCSGMCPLWFESGSVLAQTEEAGADAEDSIDLYGYLSGNSPDNAVFYLPACTVATAMTADIDTDNVVPPSVAVAFVTDLSNSMGWSVDGSDESAVAPNRRIDYVVEAMSEGIATLYDADLGGMSVALVGFSGAKDFTSSTWDASNGSPGYYIDYDAKDGSYLLDSTYESDLLAAAELYLTDPGQVSSGDATNAHDPRYLLQWTPTYKGVEQGVSLLDGSGADIKVLILLSDGNLTHDKDWTQCSGSSALEACVAQIRDDIVGDAANSDILFYSAAITGDDTEAGYIAHLSSDECGTDYSDEADCAGHYFYRAETAEEIGEMYEDIVDSILGFTFTLTTEADGSVETTTGTVVEGRNQVLPFPENFECTGEEMGVPFTVEFNGDGYVTIGDIQFTYCPVP